MKRIFLLLPLLVFWFHNLNAQTVPQGINYQTIVRGSNNDPLPGAAVTLQFQIKDGIGSLVYQEEQTDNANDNGLVNLVIGQGTPQFGDFQSIDWSIGPRTLTVFLKNPAGAFDPLGTMQLMSVPYALYAAQSKEASSAESLADLGALPGQVLQWNGAAWVPANDATGGNGTVTQINTGTGLTGGPIATSGTIALTNTGVVPGTYGGANKIPVITLDAQGRVTNLVELIVDPGAVIIGEGNGIDVAVNSFNNFTIINTGDTDTNDDVLKSTPHNGDLVGTYNTLDIKAGVVGTSELANQAVTGAKIDDMGAANNQVLKYNGTSWVPADDLTGGGGNNYSEGLGINITGSAPNFVIENSGDTDGNDDVLKTTAHNGDVNGDYNDLQIKADAVTANEIAPNAVNASELADNAVNTAELVNGAVTAIKLNQMGAVNGKVLKYNGTSWAPADDLTGGGGNNYTEGTGIDITGTAPNFVITNSGDTDGNDDVLKTTGHDGDLSGEYNTLQLKADVVTSNEIAANAVSTSELANEAVTGAKIDDMGAVNGKVLKYNGTSWAPADDLTAGGGNNYSEGTGIDITGTVPNFVITNSGDTDGNDDVLKTTGHDGDLSGEYNSLQLKADVVTSNEIAANAVNTSELADNAVTNAKMADNSVNTSELANGAVTALKLNQMSATTDQVLRWNGTAWAPATFAYTTCGRVNSPDGQERILVSNQNMCPGAAQFEVNTTLAEGFDVDVNGAGDVKGARVEAKGGSGSNDGIILFSRSDNNEATGVNLATGRNNNTTDVVGLRVMSGLQVDNMSEVNYDFNNGNGSNQNYGMHAVASDNSENNFENFNNYGRNLDMGIYAFSNLTDWAAYLDGNMYAVNAWVGDDLHILNYADQNNVNADWRLDVVDAGSNAFGLSFYYNGALRAYIDEVSGQYWPPSDASLKEHVLPLPSILSKTNQLKPVSYNFIDDKSKTENWGFISQDVEKIFPEMTKKMTLEDKSSLTLLNYAGFSVIAIKAIQEQQQIIEAQQAKLDKQEDRLTSLEKEMAEMKAMLKASVMEQSSKK